MATYRNLGYNSFLIRSIKKKAWEYPTEDYAVVPKSYSDLGFEYNLSNRDLQLPTMSPAEIRNVIPPYSIYHSRISPQLPGDYQYWKWIDVAVEEGGSSHTGLIAPSSFTDGSSHWANETNVYTDDNNYTYSTDATPPCSLLELYGFNCGVPGGATIDGLLFYVTAKAATASGGTSLLKHVQVTWDAGTTWSDYIAAVPFPIWSDNFDTTKRVYTVGGTGEDWQHTWTLAEINSTTNFGFRFAADWDTDEIPYIYYVAVDVYYTT